MNNDPISDADVLLLIAQYRWLKNIHNGGVGTLSFSISITEDGVTISSENLEESIKHSINHDTIFAFDRVYKFDKEEK